MTEPSTHPAPPAGARASLRGAAEKAPARRPYSPPRLERFGDIRDLTLGSSPGTGESGNPLVFRP